MVGGESRSRAKRAKGRPPKKTRGNPGQAAAPKKGANVPPSPKLSLTSASSPESTTFSPCAESLSSAPTSHQSSKRSQARSVTPASSGRQDILVRRQRNRLAASKCRVRRNVEDSKLQDESRVVIERNTYLVSCVEDLKAEVVGLKNELLKDGHCDCDLMRLYLVESAKSFVNSR